jgi:hypothetical protein
MAKQPMLAVTEQESKTKGRLNAPAESHREEY